MEQRCQLTLDVISPAPELLNRKWIALENPRRLAFPASGAFFVF
jgi:hypothetical protein